VSIKINKNFAKKLKTEPQMDDIRNRYQVNDVKERNKTVQTINRLDKSFVKNLEVAGLNN